MTSSDSMLFAEHPEFQFCQDWENGIWCEAAMMTGWLKNKKRPAEDCALFAMMYDSRLDMLGRVLKGGEYGMEELKLQVR